MPVYTYRREDGTTFDVRQSFSDSALTVDPTTGQRVVRVVQAAGVIFKGSGFYVNDSKSTKSVASNTNGSKSNESKAEGESTGSSETKSEGATKPDAAATSTAAPAAAPAPAKTTSKANNAAD